MRRLCAGYKKSGWATWVTAWQRKKRAEKELVKEAREYYSKIGSAYNQYIADANDELPLSLGKLPYIK